MSKLNPYAASYIPLVKRETTKSSESNHQSAWYGLADHELHDRQHDKAPSISGVSTNKSQFAFGFYGSSSQKPNEVEEKRVLDEEYEMDLDYLRMIFPGISDESLGDVYMANNCDLEASIDMLNQLESDTHESSGNLPDSLDISDASEALPTVESSSVKLKNVVGEASASTSVSVIIK